MREITGRKVLLFTVGAFGVIIAVNLFMAYSAVSTFPGLEVKNSYVASQSFDADRRAQLALGWQMDPVYDPVNGELRLAFTDKQGFAAEVATLSVLVGRSTVARDDTRPSFTQLSGVFSAPLVLAPGNWMMQVEATANDGTVFRQRITLAVKG